MNIKVAAFTVSEKSINDLMDFPIQIDTIGMEHHCVL